MKILSLKKWALVLVGVFGLASTGFCAALLGPAAVAHTDARIDLNPVGDYTLDKRDTWVGRANHCVVSIVEAAFLPASIAVVNNVYAKCGLLEFSCAIKEVQAFTSLVALAAGSVVLTATYFKWKFQNAKFTGTGTSRNNLKTEITNVLNNATWTKTAQNLDDFVDFALGQYESMYRDSSKKFNMNAFKSALKSWRP